MTDERFEHLMRDAALTYRTPPETPLDEMWTEIEAGGASFSAPRRTWVRYAAIAATLIIGIAIGRVSKGSPGGGGIAVPRSGTAAAVAARPDSGMAEPYQLATTRYLGQTAALLIALPSSAKPGGGQADAQFVARAGDLLTTTRLLLDSPAANDPQMRSLLEDLELVLAQVVHLPSNQNKTELDLINQALEQHDVLPRLRTAVADISAN